MRLASIIFLFVLGPVLMVPRKELMVETVTTFPLAHRITLALATFDYRTGSARDEFAQEILAGLVEDIETKNDSQSLPVIE